MQKVLVEAAIVVAVILFAFLLNWRTTAISLTAIPVSILATAVIFYFAGLSINTMTLGGIAIAIGELVDDAVVDVENIFRRLRENRAAGNPRSVFDVVVTASQEVRSGIVYATMIIVLVFVPLFALSGIEGRLFAPLGEAYIISILASLVVSITLTPVMAYYMLPRLKRLDEHESRLVRVLKGANRRALEAAFRHPRMLVLSILGAVVIAGIGALLLPRAFLPPFNEGTFTINMLFNPGVSLAEFEPGRADRRADHPGGARGQVGGPKDGPRRTRRTCRGRPLIRDRGRSEDGRAVQDGDRDRHPLAPGRAAAVDQCGSADFPPAGPHALGRARRDRAQDIRRRPRHAARRRRRSLRTRLAVIPGLTDLQVEKQVRIPQLEIRVDYKRASLYGVQPGAVVEQLSRLSNGRVVSRVVDGYRRFDVMLRLPDNMRTTQRLGDLLIETPFGWIPARHLAEIRETDGPNQILRENGRRRVVVMANTDGTANMTSIVASIRDELAAVKMPEGYFTALEGTFQAQEQASRTIGLLSILSLAMIFAILYSRYRSAVLTLIIMGSVPLALIGSVAALWIAGQPLSVASMIGFITLTGIAARNGILKISHYINLSLQEGMPVRAGAGHTRKSLNA